MGAQEPTLQETRSQPQKCRALIGWRTETKMLSNVKENQSGGRNDPFHI
jgi:hypothetical protein